VPSGKCKAVRKLSKERLEGEFISLLKHLRPDAKAATPSPKIAAKAWADQQAGVGRNEETHGASRLTLEVKELQEQCEGK
jgi:hypothetical protein